VRWLKWAGIAMGSLVGAAVLVLLVAIIWENSTAVSVQFVNDTGVPVSLPDCSTDLAFIGTNQTAKLSVASVRPDQCTVDNTDKETVIGCITMPTSISAETTIRLSKTHPCS
jgi:hypothetical protein